MSLARAVFLDRDGVLVDDVGPLVRSADVRVLPGVAEALSLLVTTGWKIVVISNQTAVARGLASEHDIRAVQHHVEACLIEAGAPAFDDFLFCPHHPRATVPAYRVACACRKPQPGLIERACVRHGIDPHRSVMIGDRPSDIVAGQRAGCRTVWVQTGRHREAPIESATPFATPAPDYTCADLFDAVCWLGRSRAA
ncbi:MAG TPA: HAD family hydrolase [Nannocystaceae bacterium]|nr:HAD family hydrolase [Nannocystaceae bacterium]